MVLDPTRLILALAFAGVAAVAAPAQERKVPDDSARISIAGCADGRVFVVAEAAGHEPTNNNIQPGRRFSLSGKKKLLSDIKKHDSQMIEVTGLVRRADIGGPGGIALGGGRVRIGGGPPREPIGDVSRIPVVEQAFLDVESWRQLPGSCRTR